MVPSGFESVLINYHPELLSIWNELDRLVNNLRGDDKDALDKFLQIMEQVKKHLAMVFHRFIENNRVKYFFRKEKLRHGILF